MRVRFARKVALPGGPLYHPGEVADLSEESARLVLGLGLAVSTSAIGMTETVGMTVKPSSKAPERPPVDKMIHRPPVQKEGCR